LGTACDMFEYSGGQCSFFPHRAFKRENLFNVIEPGNGKNIYVLQCAAGQENIVTDSDLRLKSYQSKSTLKVVGIRRFAMYRLNMPIRHSRFAI